MNTSSFLIDAYKPGSLVFPVTPPVIISGYVYHFTTPSGLLYEVRFGAKRDNYLGIVVNFSVLDEEFDHEYAVTNRGEIYGVVATVIEIVRQFHENHPLTTSYEFSGEFKDDEVRGRASIRTRLYLRYANQILNPNWKTIVVGNKVTLKKMC